MSRTPLSYYSSYYVDTKVDPAAVTNYGGIFPYLDLMVLLDLPQLVNEYLPEKSMRAWQHAEHVAALLALNLIGGDCVEELVKLDDTQWEKVYDKRGRLDYEVAEVPFVSNTEALIKAEPYRHIVVRRQAKQGILPGLGINEAELANEETMEIRG